ncbi:hypothetical protein NP233_g1390 [Leucocoprinus birnbaumii]|uniref:DUF6534 domain-containing protein n=1 Tax=Leucocoprinus birnbaumii TaxID=56174 RepID=A0AAD5YY02_9AGAR|nr:hypothetical protein NP233_g1390 [Leucocoprinus birnbaumii]
MAESQQPLGPHNVCMILAPTILTASYRGPIVLGITFDLILLGILTTQTYFYYLAFPKDRKLLKFAVVSAWAIGVAQSGLAIYDLFLIQSFAGRKACGVPLRNDVAHYWFSVNLASALVASTAQWIYTNRIYVMSRRRWLVLPIVFLSCAQLGSSILGCFCTYGESVYFSGLTSEVMRDYRDQLAMNTKPINFLGIRKSLNTISLSHPNICFTGYYKLWGPLNVACDFLITASLAIILLRSRGRTVKKSMHNRLTGVVQLIIETGLATVVVVSCFVAFSNSTVSLLKFLYSPKPTWSLFAGLAMGKIYSNSMMALLNNRAVIGGSRRMHSRAIDTDILRSIPLRSMGAGDSPGQD